MPQVKYAKSGRNFAELCTNTLLPYLGDGAMDCQMCVTPVRPIDACSISLFTQWGGGDVASFEMTGVGGFTINGIEGIVDYNSELNNSLVDVFDYSPHVEPVTDADINSLGFPGVGAMVSPNSAGVCGRCGGGTVTSTIGLDGPVFSDLRIQKTVSLCYTASTTKISSITEVDPNVRTSFVTC